MERLLIVLFSVGLTTIGNCLPFNFVWADPPIVVMRTWEYHLVLGPFAKDSRLLIDDVFVGLLYVVWPGDLPPAVEGIIWFCMVIVASRLSAPYISL